MTGPTRREIEQDLDDLAADCDTDPSDLMIVHEDPETGEWFRDDDYEEPVDPAVAEQANPLMKIRETVVETDWEPDNDT